MRSHRRRRPGTGGAAGEDRPTSEGLLGTIQVLGSGAAYDPVFAVAPPNIALSMEGGPDVLVATRACAGSVLLGSLRVTDEGEGVWVTLSPGIGGGAADCAETPGEFLYGCRPFSSLGSTP